MGIIFKNLKIGKIVLYVHRVDNEPGVMTISPAVVVHVDDKGEGICDLFVMHRGGQFTAQNVAPSKDAERGKWHWMKIIGEVTE
jgi:hypothetical protein